MTTLLEMSSSVTRQSVQAMPFHMHWFRGQAGLPQGSLAPPHLSSTIWPAVRLRLLRRLFSPSRSAGFVPCKHRNKQSDTHSQLLQHTKVGRCVLS